MSNKRARESDEDVDLQPNSKRPPNTDLQNELESIRLAEQSQYADSGVNLTYAAGCTEEENYDTGISSTYGIIRSLLIF
jgi:hypothetical protein